MVDSFGHEIIIKNRIPNRNRKKVLYISWGRVYNGGELARISAFRTVVSPYINDARKCIVGALLIRIKKRIGADALFFMLEVPRLAGEPSVIKQPSPDLSAEARKGVGGSLGEG